MEQIDDRRNNRHSAITNNNNLDIGFGGKLMRSVYFITSMIAAYLSFKINKGVSWSIIIALLFSPLYIIYVLAVHGKKVLKVI